MAARLWTLGPHNHSLGRLWRFRDGRLETAYRLQCDVWAVHVVLVHTFSMGFVFSGNCLTYINYHLTFDFWLNIAWTSAALALGVVVYYSRTIRRHIIPFHSVFCCFMVVFSSAIISVQLTAWADEAAARWPPGVAPAALAPLVGFTRQTLASYSILLSFVWTASQWILLALTGVNMWSTAAYFCTFCMFFACMIACPSQSVSSILSNVVLVTGCFVGILGISLILEHFRRSRFLAQTQLAQELEASQLADSILNHTLKNILADVAANLEVFLAGTGSAALLQDCIAYLRRGMQTCKERQVYLKLAAGEYQPVPSPVRLPGLAHQLVAGRPIKVQAPDIEVPLDATLMALILENAISNAFRHGRPDSPDVRFIIREHARKPGEPGRVQFTVSNAAHPDRPPLTPRAVQRLFERRGGPQPEASDGVSFHIGLSHCVLAAKCGGIDLELTQDGNRVCLVASLDVPPEAGSTATTAASARVDFGRLAMPDLDLPRPQANLRFFCIDDSVAAQRLLVHHIQRHFPGAVVRCFGASEHDVAQFLSTAMAEADVVILDQNLDSVNLTTYGTDLVRQLLDGGYAGLVCIRSADDSAEDRARYTASGAHCTLGKDLLGAQMMEELAAAYAAHHGFNGAKDLTLSPADDILSPVSSFHSTALPAQHIGDVEGHHPSRPHSSRIHRPDFRFVERQMSLPGELLRRATDQPRDSRSQ